jgi:hypothetical protein
MNQYNNDQENQQLLELFIQYGWLEGAVLGISQQVISKGVKSLTKKQQEVIYTYALKPFEGLDYEDIPIIADMGYDGKNTKILNAAREIKQQLGYIPDNDAREEDLAYRWAVEEEYK